MTDTLVLQNAAFVEFYVSPAGNDRWSGRLAEPNEDGTDGPFATIGAARDMVRAYRAQEEEKEKKVSIRIREGVYSVEEAIFFGPDDGAVTYAAFPGECAVIDGGRRIMGWKTEILNGIEVWVKEIPKVAQGHWYFRQLFVNGRRRQRPRLPKKSFFRITDVPASAVADETFAQELFKGSDTFRSAPGDLCRWKNMQDVEVVVLHYWIEERMPILSYDEATHTVTSSRRSMFNLKDDWTSRFARYYVDNVQEALNQPGEWYLDKKTGKLYYFPMSEETRENTEVYAPVVEQLLVLQGKPEEGRYVEGLVFEGLTFRHTDWHQPEGGGERFDGPGINFAASPQAAFHIPGVIRLEGARSCTIQDCTIQHIGWYGIELGEGCKDIRIVGNIIEDMGAGGVKLDGANTPEKRAHLTGNNHITDNVIRGGGQVFHSAVGILSVHSFGNTIAHNHIHDLFYTGISCGWVWGYAENVSRDNLIEKNRIHDLGHGLLSDMGGIYTLGIQPGTVIRGNVIHDIEKYNYGGWAIYPDEGSSHIIIENNICYNTSSQCFNQHYGRENIVRNNIFAFGREGLIAHGRADEENSFTFERNILVTEGYPLFVGGYAGQLEKRSFISDLNLFWDVSGKELVSGNGKHDENAHWHLYKLFGMKEWNDLGYDLHSMVADPCFKDMNGFDFTLAENSPAADLGFHPIDISDVGPRAREASFTV